jgi:hypothetical protein
MVDDHNCRRLITRAGWHWAKPQIVVKSVFGDSDLLPGDINYLNSNRMIGRIRTWVRGTATAVQRRTPVNAKLTRHHDRIPA